MFLYSRLNRTLARMTKSIYAVPATAVVKRKYTYNFPANTLTKAPAANMRTISIIDASLQGKQFVHMLK